MQNQNIASEYFWLLCSKLYNLLKVSKFCSHQCKRTFICCSCSAQLLMENLMYCSSRRGEGCITLSGRGPVSQWLSWHRLWRVTYISHCCDSMLYSETVWCSV